jgi:molybdopterin synthase sulfur carrier subunit
MFIQVTGYLTFRKLIPARRMEFPEQGATLHSLLAALVEEIGEPFQVGVFDEKRGGLQKSVAVLINGHHYTHLPTGLETPLQEGDQVAIFPPIAGG